MASHPLMFEAGLSPCCGILCRDVLSTHRGPAKYDLNHKIRVVLGQRSGVLCSGIDSQASTTKYKTARSSKASKSDADLRRELQLFLVSAGLPPDRVPSTKELSNRGREDLANIVRRRGYKAVGRLLADLEIEPSAKGKGNEVPNLEGSKGSNVASNSGSYAIKVELPHNGSARPVEHGSSDGSNEPVEPKSLLSREDGDFEVSAKNDTSDGHSLSAHDTKLGSLTEKDTEEQKLYKQAAQFVKTGKLDFMQDFGEEQDGDDDDGEDADDGEDGDDYYEYSSEEEDNEGISDGKKSAEAIALEKAAKLRAKLLPFIKGTLSGKINKDHDGGLLRVMQKPTNFEEMYRGDSGMQFAFTAKTEGELDYIRSALSREVDLVGLSRELEETKAQLALVQAKAMAELAQVKQMALEKDMRLKSADQALANLKKVQIEYWGEGGTVELAGSFNGWQHFIAMEPDPNSEIAKSDGSRGPMIWGTELWLYPGIYEIKFIVDGNWQIDQRREVMTGNAHQNNILRVEP